MQYNKRIIIQLVKAQQGKVKEMECTITVRQPKVKLFLPSAPPSKNKVKRN